MTLGEAPRFVSPGSFDVERRAHKVLTRRPCSDSTGSWLEVGETIALATPEHPKVILSHLILHPFRRFAPERLCFPSSSSTLRTRFRASSKWHEQMMNSCPSQGLNLTLALLRPQESLRRTYLGDQPLSGATPDVGASDVGSGSSSSSKSYENFSFEIWYRDHTSDNIAEDPYSWVDSKVTKVSSILTCSSALLGMAKAICQRGPWSVSVSPCQYGELICSGPAEGAKQFFYLYDTLHSKLGVKLPFTHFERAVLHALNVVPTQLHPNSWAFVRAFELLCEDLGKAPPLGVFFWFFSPRKTDKVGWTSLSNQARRKLLKPFLESYKTFKNRFFRVVPSDSGPNLLVDHSRRPFFPLHWTRQPAVSITVDRKDLEAWEHAFIIELEGLPFLFSTEIIKGTGYSTQALKELRKRKEQQVSQSVGLEAEAAPLSVARPADPPQVSQEGTSCTPSIIVLDRNQGTPEESTERPSKCLHLEEPAPVDFENQAVGHEESALQTSHPKNLLINFDTFTQAADQALGSLSLGQEVGWLGPVGTYTTLQQYVAHGFALAHTAEKAFGFLESEHQSWADRGKKSEEEILKWSSAYVEAEVKLNNYRSTTDKLQEDLWVALQMNKDLLQAKSEWLQVKSDFEQEKDSLQSELRKLRQDIDDLEGVQRDQEGKLVLVEESLKQAQESIVARDQTIFQ
ncbi:hypothetical protein CR513_15073, partial [Mucuna pruriens]